MSKKYKYQYIDQGSLRFEEGTQSLLALFRKLDEMGQEGWRVVHVNGDLENEFQMLLMQEIG